MFQWYQNSKVCYVYMQDVPEQDNCELSDSFRQSRWYTRGWTLQELLAPSDVIFYSKNWHVIGTKSTLCGAIQSVTGIQDRYLLGDDISTASISQRMSWASRRNTSRTEDEAYCLLGIFDVNIPLIYGEGRKAFQRLQEAVLKAYPEDHTLYAWGDTFSWPPPVNIAQIWGRNPLPWSRPEERQKLVGLLASSPRDFKHSESFVPSRRAAEFYRNEKIKASFPVQTGTGIIHLELPMLPHVDWAIYSWDQPRIAQLRLVVHAVLLCGFEGDIGSSVVIPLQECGNMVWARTRELLVLDEPAEWELMVSLKRYMCIGPDPRRSTRRLQENDIVFRRRSAGTMLDSHQVQRGLNYVNTEYILRPNVSTHGALALARLFTLKQYPTSARGFSIIYRRQQSTPQSADPPLVVSIVPVTFGEAPLVASDGTRWYSSNNIMEAQPLCSHVMATPRDTWLTSVKDLQSICVQVERVAFDTSGSYIDVVDELSSYDPGRLTESFTSQ